MVAELAIEGEFGDDDLVFYVVGGDENAVEFYAIGVFVGEAEGIGGVVDLVGFDVLELIEEGGFFGGGGWGGGLDEGWEGGGAGGEEGDGAGRDGRDGGGGGGRRGRRCRGGGGVVGLELIGAQVDQVDADEGGIGACALDGDGLADFDGAHDLGERALDEEEIGDGLKLELLGVRVGGELDEGGHLGDFLRWHLDVHLFGFFDEEQEGDGVDLAEVFADDEGGNGHVAVFLGEPHFVGELFPFALGVVVFALVDFAAGPGADDGVAAAAAGAVVLAE